MIFLSYAKEDGDRAAKIFAVLSRPNRPVFYDKDALMPGMDWRFEIEEKVRKSNLIIILLSHSSVSKEGFVQREIRLALDRAEMMPDGRIFIIPVRLDDVTVPAKLAKYQWLDMPSDEDVFDLEYAVDFAQALIDGNRSSGQSEPGEDGFDKSLLREKVVILLQGKNVYGDPIFTYLKLPLWKLQTLRNAMRAQQDFMPAEYGFVLAAGRGVPDEEVRAAMAREHNMIDVPSPHQRDDEAQRQAEQLWVLGFGEAYRSIVGADATVPDVALPVAISDYDNALREGIQHGLDAARAVAKGPA